MIKLRRAIFLDRDGVINDMVYRGENCFILGKKVRWTAPWTYNEFHLKLGIHKTLQDFHNAGYLTILVTNQPDIAYGIMTREHHERIMADVRRLPLDDIFICEHGRDDGCECKKPKYKMLLDATKKWKIDSVQSYMVGDTKNDSLAGRAIGCRVVILDDGRNSDIETDYRVKRLEEFNKILTDTMRI